MKMMWCWRCQCEMPMLDDEEYHQFARVLQEGIQQYKFRKQNGEKLTMNEIFEPAMKEYERMTGLAGIHPNVIAHHRIADFGDPCTNCGKPLRTPQAKLCAACGQRK